MPDVYQYTRYGYQVVDPDDAPTLEEQFQEQLAWIWQEATTSERQAIVHERYALGIKNKAPRELTATEQAVIDAELAFLARQEAAWAAEEERRQKALEAAYYASLDWEDSLSAIDYDEYDDLPF